MRAAFTLDSSIFKDYVNVDYAGFSQNPSLACQHRRGTLIPYIRYKEEILSSWPKIVLFHDVISDAEASFLRTRAYPSVSIG